MCYAGMNQNELIYWGVGIFQNINTSCKTCPRLSNDKISSPHALIYSFIHVKKRSSINEEAQAAFD